MSIATVWGAVPPVISQVAMMARFSRSMTWTWAVSPRTTNIRGVAASNAMPDGSVPPSSMLPARGPVLVSTISTEPLTVAVAELASAVMVT